MSISCPQPPSGIFKSITPIPRCRHLLRWMVLFLAIPSCTLALPTTVTPVDDNLNLDVGQQNMISTQNWALGVSLIILGLVEVFYGFRFIRLTLLVAGFLSWAVVTVMLMLVFQWDLVYALFKPQHYAFWIWLMAGLTGAAIAFRFWDLGVTFTGAFGGFALAMGIIAVANLSIGNAGRYIILVLLILGGATIATFFERVFIICGTSCGGAYVFMFGVDQFAQTGYREMIVIFDFTGKTLIYHPNLQVYIMLGSSLILAGLGIAWEFWHHSKPLLMDRKAVFRIYGRPFGKRPKKLVGQRIHNHLKTRSDVYRYLIGFNCLKRHTIDDVLYDGDCCAPVPPQIPVAGGQPSTTPEEQDASGTKEPKTTTPLDDSGAPLKAAPTEDSEKKPAGTSEQTLSEVVIDDGQHSERAEQRQESGTTDGIASSGTERKEGQEDSESHNVGPVVDSVDAGPSSSTHPSTKPSLSGPYHPLFSNQGARTVQLIRLVSEDTSPGNTIPREFFSQHSHVHPGAYTSRSIWPLSLSSSSLDVGSSSLDVGSTSSLLPSHGPHMLEVSESSQDEDEVQDDVESTQDENDVPPRPIIVFREIMDE